MTHLKIQAGPKAFKHIQEKGLSPKDISAIFGASGAAKWLAICGLDKAIFGEWLQSTDHKIDLFGTSVGAFKLAAGAQTNPVLALDNLAQAYIDQCYEGKVGAEQIAIETKKILDAFISLKTIQEILDNHQLNFHCASVRCLGWLGSENDTLQKIAMVKAFFLALLGRRFHNKLLERAIFNSNVETRNFEGNDGFTSHQIQLNTDNFAAALLSSGSIPVVMQGISNISGAPTGTYRDGGILDYHPVPQNLTKDNQGLVLYPHFYAHLKEGWFDKFTPWRKVNGTQLDNVVLISPSESFVANLPGGQIPDRKDFYTFKENDSERVRRWELAKDKSNLLGDEFLSLVNSGEIASKVELIEN